MSTSYAASFSGIRIPIKNRSKLNKDRIQLQFRSLLPWPSKRKSKSKSKEDTDKRGYLEANVHFVGVTGILWQSVVIVCM